MKICVHLRVLPNAQQPSANMRHTWTDPYIRTHSTYNEYLMTTHGTGVVYTRIVVSVVVRPKKA